MKFSLKVIAAIAIISLAGYVVLSFFKPSARVVQVKTGLAVNAVSGNARVLSAMELVVRSEIGGYLVKSIYDPGKGAMAVKEGDVIAQVDTSNLDLEIDKTRTEIESLQKRIKIGLASEMDVVNFKQDLEYSRKLAEINQYPQKDLERKERDMVSLVRQLERQKLEIETILKHQEQALAVQKHTRSKMTVLAPMNGLITEGYAFKGDYVANGSPVVKIIAPERIVEVSLSEEDYPGVNVGQRASVLLLGYSDKMLPGKVSVLLATANPDSKRRSVYVHLDNIPSEIAPGMTGEASIVKAERPNSLIVPRRALLGDYVYVVENGKVRVHKVVVGFRSLNKVELLSGVKAGDWVITEDLQNFREGDRVSITPEEVAQ